MQRGKRLRIAPRVLWQGAAVEISSSHSQLFEMAHEVGGGLGGLLNFGEFALAVRGAINVLVEEVGIGGNDAKKIVQRVRDGLGTTGDRRRRICKTQG